MFWPSQKKCSSLTIPRSLLVQWLKNALSSRTTRILVSLFFAVVKPITVSCCYDFKTKARRIKYESLRPC